MTNAAGVMEYCVEHNVVDNNVKSVKDQVLSKLGLSSTTAQQQNRLPAGDSGPAEHRQRSAAESAEPEQLADG